jgi:hypothetical protein
MELIQQEYLANHKESLEKAVKKETSGCYKEALLALMGGSIWYSTDALYTLHHANIMADVMASQVLYSLYASLHIRYYARTLKQAFKGIGTDEAAVLRTLACNTRQDARLIAIAYEVSTHAILYSYCTVLILYCTHCYMVEAEFGSLCTVLTVYCTHCVLCSLCTVLTI